MEANLEGLSSHNLSENWGKRNSLDYDNLHKQSTGLDQSSILDFQLGSMQRVAQSFAIHSYLKYLVLHFSSPKTFSKQGNIKTLHTKKTATILHCSLRKQIRYQHDCSNHLLRSLLGRMCLRFSGQVLVRQAIGFELQLREEGDWEHSYWR